MYARDIEGETLTFGVSGKLIMNALVMFDRQTDTLWSQFLGEAVEGPLRGTPLEVVPAVLTRWESWRQLHPDTTVLDQGGPVIDAYSGYYFSPQAGVIGERNRDDRLVGKELVHGVVVPQGRKAYAHRFLAKNPVVNDLIGNQPVLVAWDGVGVAAIAYDPTVDGRLLTFEAHDDVDSGAALRDLETGTVWSALTGEALTGELEGARLEVLPGFAVFWFAWSDYFPDTDVFLPEG